MIALVDYGAGNLRSVENAVSTLGYRSIITNRSSAILDADAVILPGVGAATDAMANLDKFGLTDTIRQVVKAGHPFLGICIGLQILFDITEEGGLQKCLGIIPGKVRKLTGSMKIPHMGWNQVKQLTKHQIFTGIPDNTNFYFVHSYFCIPDNDAVVIATTDYDISFCSVLAKNNLVATQFHPEKSGSWGLKVYDNFLKSDRVM